MQTRNNKYMDMEVSATHTTTEAPPRLSTASGHINTGEIENNSQHTTASRTAPILDKYLRTTTSRQRAPSP